MSGFYPHREHTEPWFRLGRLEVSSVMFVVLLVAASWLAWVIVGPIWTQTLAFIPADVASGQAWRIFTWPLADGLSLWGALTLFFFWYFGTELEGQIGRRRMASLLVGIWGSLTVAYTTIAVIFSATSIALIGISLVEFLLLLIWIAEYPLRPLFFRIPAWIFGVVIVGVQILSMIAYRQLVSLLTLVLALVLVAVAARRSGLLAAYSWIPGRPAAQRPRVARVPRAQQRAAHRSSTDQEHMDALLDQIHEHGLHSLTTAQRNELKKLSDRRRQG